MKIAVDIGHNAPVDTGAVGIKKEDDLNLAVGQKLIKILLDNGHQVIETCPHKAAHVNYSLQNRVAVANNSDADIFVSIHFNAANFHAHGAEVYAWSKAGGAIARSILNEIVELGFHNRGVKKANFYVLRKTSMPAVLVECCFCDSRKDMSIFVADTMAQAIAEGLIGEIKPMPNEMRTLTIKHQTYFKATVEQAKDLPPEQRSLMKPAKYQVLAALPEEEGHHWVRMLNGKEGFIFAGHSEIS